MNKVLMELGLMVLATFIVLVIMAIVGLIYAGFLRLINRRKKLRKKQEEIEKGANCKHSYDITYYSNLNAEKYKEYKDIYCKTCSKYQDCDYVPIDSNGRIIENFENAEVCRDFKDLWGDKEC